MSKILILTPSLNPHGGIRVLVEWSNTLARRGHDVTLQVSSGPLSRNWVTIQSNVNVVGGSNIRHKSHLYDIIIAGTPHLALMLNDIQTKAQKFFLLQMAEDLFAPNRASYVQMCRESYKVPFPIIGISKWVAEHVRQYRGETKPMYYIGNGVSHHFYYDEAKRASEPTLMVEGWNGYNYAKDTEQLTARVAAKMKEEFPEIRIIGFGNQSPTGYTHALDEYIVGASAEKIASMAQSAWMMFKASRYDARSCSPVEAMKCGTPTARALILGDDDLIHNYNALRSGYEFEAFFEIVKELYLNADTREILQLNGLHYAEKALSWNYWMEEVENNIFNG